MLHSAMGRGAAFPRPSRLKGTESPRYGECLSSLSFSCPPAKCTMATTVSAASLDGVADPRLGDEADAIGTIDEHRGGVSDEIAAPDPHGHNTIYLDNSITFENYHYWANRSRAFEKHIRTDNAGLAQIGNMLIGRKIQHEQPIVDGPQSAPAAAMAEKASNHDQGNESANEKAGGNGVAEWSHGITEAEWEQAQRATRTATWGK